MLIAFRAHSTGTRTKKSFYPYRESETVYGDGGGSVWGTIILSEGGETSWTLMIGLSRDTSWTHHRRTMTGFSGGSATVYTSQTITPGG